MCHVILVVEDREDTSDLIEFALQNAGYGTMSTKYGKSALRMLSGIDAVLLDIMLPDLNGIDVLKAIRAKKANKGIKVILFTAAKFSELEQKKFLKMGASAFISKPIALKDLIAKLKVILMKKPAGANVAAAKKKPEAKKSKKSAKKPAKKASAKKRKK